MKVLKLREDAKLPTKADGDMCYDLYACIDHDIWVFHGEVIKVPTKICIDFGEYHASIRPRSGLASKGIDVLGGQIDASYRGEIIVMLTNHTEGHGPHRISNGDKIAQMKLEKDITVEVTEAFSSDELSSTARGANGFGSTGK